MALPKEPRQKMINLMYLVLTALLALNVSNEILNAFKVVDNSLLSSNGVIKNSNALISASLGEQGKKTRIGSQSGNLETKSRSGHKHGKRCCRKY